MKMLRFIKVTAAVLFTVISFLSIATILVWQYLAYKKESNEFKLQIRMYEEYYLKDRNKLGDKTVEQIQTLIDHTEQKINKCSALLPQSNYLNLYNFISEIKKIFELNDVVFKINDIVPVIKDFYEELNLSALLSGRSENIYESIKQMIDKNELIVIHNLCLSNKLKDNLSTINMNFKAYMYLNAPEMERMKPEKTLPAEERKINTWLPPLSAWVKAYKDKVIELKQLEKTKQDLKKKLDMFEKYKKKLKLLRELEIIIEHLGDPHRKPDVSLNSIPECKND